MEQHQKLSFINVYFIFLFALQCTVYVSCKWCTHIIAEEHVFTVMELSLCNKSYLDSCGWFSSQQCTFYESVPCYVDRNQTVVLTKSVQDCCAGYVKKLDSNNNVTCARKSEKTGFGRTSSRGGSYIVQYYASSDDLLFGLSHGAYAGIICAFLFVACVIILLIVHGIKRRRRNRATKQNMEKEIVEKMIPLQEA